MYVPPPSAVPTSSPTMPMVLTLSPTLSLVPSFVQSGNLTTETPLEWGENGTTHEDQKGNDDEAIDDNIGNITMLESGVSDNNRENHTMAKTIDGGEWDDDQSNETNAFRYRRLKSSQDELF